jgi:hypothetical protein
MFGQSGETISELVAKEVEQAELILIEYNHIRRTLGHNLTFIKDDDTPVIYASNGKDKKAITCFEVYSLLKESTQEGREEL